MPSTVQMNIPLAPLTTLGAGGSAEYLARVSNEGELREVVMWAKAEGHGITILGGGSNVLIADSGVAGVVIVPAFSEVTYSEHEGRTLVTSGAGVVLDELVRDAVLHGLWGIENLSGIPGTVGAVPIQNVGAYGVEATDVVQTVTVYDIEQNVVNELLNDACAFAYRDSIFKHELGKRFIIMNVVFALTTMPNPKISYRDLKNFFGANCTPSIQEIRDAVLSIRSQKFPDWRVMGTAGSFFKNPIVEKEVFVRIQEKYPEITAYEESDGRMKIPLGLVLDRVCNLKGYRVGNVGLYEKQALVLVCERGTRAEEIKKFSDEIIARVQEKIGITIEREVTFVP